MSYNCRDRYNARLFGLRSIANVVRFVKTVVKFIEALEEPLGSGNLIAKHTLIYPPSDSFVVRFTTIILGSNMIT